MTNPAPSRGRPARTSAALVLGCVAAAITAATPGRASAQDAAARPDTAPPAPDSAPAADTVPQPPVRCQLVEVGGYTLRARVDSVSFVHHAVGGIDYRCSDGMQVLADSAVIHEATQQVHLFGRVRLEDAQTELNADTVQYFEELARIIAWSNVTVADRGSGAIIQGERMVYDRATEFRTLDRMMVYEGAPHATIPSPARADPGDGNPPARRAPIPAPEIPPETVADSTGAGELPPSRDSVGDGPAGQAEAQSAAEDEGGQVGNPLPPYEVDADRFILEGRRYFRAGGSVVVVRDSMHAFGDSLDYDQQVGAMSVLGGARVEDRSYTLTAATVSVTPSGGAREELLARRDAQLEGERVRMAAPSIRMFLDGGEVTRLVAVGEVPPLPGEPQPIDTRGLTAGDAARLLALATVARQVTESEEEPDSVFQPSVDADQFQLLGDSIDVLSPGQALETVTAVGTARAEGEPGDSASVAGLPEAARRDWLEGETIVARFAPADSGAGSRLESLTATGSARSLYRLADTTSTAGAAPDPSQASALPDAGQRATSDSPTPSDSSGAPPGHAAPDSVAAGEGESAEMSDAGADAAATGAPEPAPGLPALHWVEGEEIVVHMEGRQVVRMDVQGQTVGYHLEPLPPDAAAPPDSAAVQDSATAPPDSAAVQDSATARSGLGGRPGLRGRPRLDPARRPSS